MARKTKSADRLNAPEPTGAGEETGRAAVTRDSAAPEPASARPAPGAQSLPEGARRLRKAWAKADDAARSQFLAWLSKKGHLPDADTAPAPVPPDPHAPSSQASPPHAMVPAAPIAYGRYLLPETVERILRRMAREKLSPADLALHLGFATDGAAIHRALRQGAALRLVLVAALSAWLAQPAPEAPDQA